MDKSIIGVDLGGTKLLMVSGERQKKISTGVNFSFEDLILSLKIFIDEDRSNIGTVGIAVPGLINEAGKVVVCDVLPKIVGCSSDKLQEALCSKVFIINDVQAALVEEMHNVDSNITGGVVMVGSAIGAAFTTNGKPILGSQGWAGELGYFPIIDDGVVTRLDELAGGSFMAEERGVSAYDFMCLAEYGDLVTQQIIHKGGHALGIGLAAVINLLNPEQLAVGGGAFRLPGYWDAVYSSVAQYSLHTHWQVCTFTRVKSGDQVVALGAMRHAQINSL